MGLFMSYGRALYLLELNGCPVEEDTQVEDPAFLADVMEANEEIAEVESVADLSGISVHNRGVIDRYVKKISGKDFDIFGTLCGNRKKRNVFLQVPSPMATWPGPAPSPSASSTTRPCRTRSGRRRRSSE